MSHFSRCSRVEGTETNKRLGTCTEKKDFWDASTRSLFSGQHHSWFHFQQSHHEFHILPLSIDSICLILTFYHIY